MSLAPHLVSLGLAAALPAQLFQGLELVQPMRATDLVGFPNLSYTNAAVFEVNGMAALDDGQTLVIAKGPFTTGLFASVLGGTPKAIVSAAIDLHGLGYGRGTLYGFANFGAPMGIYSVSLATGAKTLELDTSAAGLRFFALDYDPIDDRLYGYSEYGSSGLYALDLDTKQAVRITGPIPAANTQGRGLAVANHVVHLTATRGADGIPAYAYDLRTGQSGTWLPFTNAYPAEHATGGAAFLEFRQPNLGYRGPGRVTLSCLGQALVAGKAATFRLHSTLANASGWLLLATTSTPTFVAQVNATLAAWPPVAAAPVTLDASGWLTVPLRGGAGPVTVYLQALVADGGVPTGYAVSNALRVDFLP